MVDTHYDLLSICYTCYLKNDYTKIEEIVKKIKNNKNNIKCIFANLYFMSKEEMFEELGENYYNPNVPVLTMFKISKQILEYYLPDIEFIYSIEGCDYIDIEDLDDLYNEGLRSIVPVWNTENKYGSGNRTDKGLTEDGISLINKAIDLGMGIDLSHANLNTFCGIIDVIKENRRLGKNVICYASHSNARMLCDNKRNLTDEQLLAIKEVNGLVGICSYSKFVNNKYIDHIIYIANLIGLDNIMLSTDDMSFLEKYKGTNIYNYKNIYNELKEELSYKYDSNEIDKIMFKNAYRIINKIM